MKGKEMNTITKSPSEMRHSPGGGIYRFVITAPQKGCTFFGFGE
jgi:hypothetical protein